jgi:hypothetical protein
LDKVRDGIQPRCYYYRDWPRLVQRFANPLPALSPLFTSPKSAAALDRTVALHLLRTAQFTTAETFIEVRVL